jgi:hypothetical protein
MIMSLDIRQEDLPEQVLLDSVLGRDQSVSRARAINLMPSSQAPNRAELLRTVLENDGDDSKHRRLAAIALWRVNTAEAREALLAAAETVDDPSVLTGVVKSLGRVGDQRALAAIQAIRDRSEGTLAAQASFAASLISHRLGLPGNDLPVPRKYEKMPRSNQGSIQLAAPAAEEVERFLEDFKNEPYDVDLSRESLRQVFCTGATWMLALSRDFAAVDHAALRQRKSVAGLLASKNPESGRYSVAFLLFTAPGEGKDQVDVLIHRSTGEQAWAGAITSGGQGKASFAIHTAGRLGIVPIEVEGVLSGHGKLELTRAVSAPRVIEKLQPLPLEIPV